MIAAARLQRRDQAETVHAGHPQIGDDGVRVGTFQRGQRVRRRAEALHRKAARLDQIAGGGEVVGIVVDDEDKALGRHSAASRA